MDFLSVKGNGIDTRKTVFSIWTHIDPSQAVG